MAQFLLLHCPYNPDTYSGHRIESITADDFTAAKLEADRLLSARWNKVPWEYRLVEIADNDSSYRLHDVTKPDNWLNGKGEY
jgi:hypothetical protein